MDTNEILAAYGRIPSLLLELILSMYNSKQDLEIEYPTSCWFGLIPP